MWSDLKLNNLEQVFLGSLEYGVNFTVVDVAGVPSAVWVVKHRWRDVLQCHWLLPNRLEMKDRRTYMMVWSQVSFWPLIWYRMRRGTLWITGLVGTPSLRFALSEAILWPGDTAVRQTHVNYKTYLYVLNRSLTYLVPCTPSEGLDIERDFLNKVEGLSVGLCFASENTFDFNSIDKLTLFCDSVHVTCVTTMVWGPLRGFVTQFFNSLWMSAQSFSGIGFS